MSTCHNNPEKSLTTKINKHIPSGYLLFTHCSFDTTFPVPVKKELNNAKSITYNIKFIDSFKIMSSSLSNLVDNLF